MILIISWDGALVFGAISTTGVPLADLAQLFLIVVN
jgi:hypothetical protein